MSYLDDSTPLNSITIPGTHNSHALKGTICALQGSDIGDQLAEKAADIYGTIGSLFTGVGLQGVGLMQDIGEKTGACQDRAIAWQLIAGVRCIDLRIGDGWTLRHGRVGLPGIIFTACAGIRDFLKANPSETVLLQAKWDLESFLTSNRKPEPPNFGRDLRDVLKNIFGDYIDLKEQESPTLGQARGKVVLCNERSQFKGRGLAKEASSNLKAIWDKYGIQGVLLAPDSALVNTPEMFAGREIPQFMQELEPLVREGKKVNLGIVDMDFPVVSGLCTPAEEPLSETAVILWGLILLNFP